MKIALAASVLALALAGCSASAQPSASEIDAHLVLAKKAAGSQFTGALVRTCIAPAGFPGEGGSGIPSRAGWYAEPAKMFDNLYFIGTKVHSSWALTTSAGIIILDTLYNYAAEEEIVGGLKKLGLDPAQVKYVIVSHAHGDHDEGAKLLQDIGTRVVMTAEDWSLTEAKAQMPGGKPKRDFVATDGQKLTLGDTTVTLVHTPGHTPGTLSFLFQVKDAGRPLTVAYSGGTAMQLIYTDPAKLRTYVASQQKFAAMAAQANATIIMSNHSEFDNAYDRSRLLTFRKAGEPHPYEVGADGVARYLTVLAECAQAQIARLK